MDHSSYATCVFAPHYLAVNGIAMSHSMGHSEKVQDIIGIYIMGFDLETSVHEPVRSTYSWIMECTG